MERAAVNAPAGGSADDDGDGRAPAIPTLGGEVHDLIVGTGNEIRKLDFGDRPQAHESGTDSCAHNRGLRNRRVDYALLAKMLEHARRDFEGAAIDPDVLRDHENIGIAH